MVSCLLVQAGRLPAATAASCELRLLDLDSNSLTGPIPRLRELTQLQYLFLGNNSACQNLSLTEAPPGAALGRHAWHVQYACAHGGQLGGCTCALPDVRICACPVCTPVLAMTQVWAANTQQQPAPCAGHTLVLMLARWPIKLAALGVDYKALWASLVPKLGTFWMRCVGTTYIGQLARHPFSKGASKVLREV